MQFSAKVTGLEALGKELEKLDAKVRNRALAEATKAMAAVVLPAFKAMVAANSDTKTSLKAVGVKHVRYKAGKLSMGIIGFRAGQARQVTRTFSKRGKQRIKLKRTKGAPGFEVKDAFKYGHIPFVTGRKAVSARKGKLAMRMKGGKVVYGKKAKAVAASGRLAAVAQQTQSAASAAGLASLRASVGL